MCSQAVNGHGDPLVAFEGHCRKANGSIDSNDWNPRFRAAMARWAPPSAAASALAPSSRVAGGRQPGAGVAREGSGDDGEDDQRLQHHHQRDAPLAALRGALFALPRSRPCDAALLVPATPLHS